MDFAAQWLACTFPYRCFDATLASDAARLGADVGRYSFIAVDLHHILLAGLPAHSAIHHLIDDTAGTPARHVDDVYRSSNGDLWQLIREASTGRILVRHTPNASSGGAVSEALVEEFLAINGSGPEHEALRLLLRKIALG